MVDSCYAVGTPDPDLHHCTPARASTRIPSAALKDMRGTVLLLGSQDSRFVYVEHFRANGLIVYEAACTDDALRQVDSVMPDVVVSVFDPNYGPSLLRDLRSRVDDATSIIVASELEHCDQVREAGADSLLLNAAFPSKVLYEIHRALILRRSGRRLT